MYNPMDIQFVGKYDYDKKSAESFAEGAIFNSFSVGIFRWELKNNGKSMKRGKVVVRVVGPVSKKGEVFEVAEKTVLALDAGQVFKKTIQVK